MRNLTLLAPLLNAISSGNLLRLIFAWAMRIGAGLTVIGVLAASFQMWSSYGRNVPASYFVSLALIQAALLALAYSILNILLIRAEDLLRQSVVPGYPVIPILATILRAFGEIAFFAYSIVGLAMGLAALFSKARIPLPVELPYISEFGSSGSAGGIMMIMGFLLGLVSLVLFYAAAEWLMAHVQAAAGRR